MLILLLETNSCGIALLQLDTSHYFALVLRTNSVRCFALFSPGVSLLGSSTYYEAQAIPLTFRPIPRARTRSLLIWRVNCPDPHDNWNRINVEASN